MPRRTNIYLDKVPLHIVQRGHIHDPGFFTEQGQPAYLHWWGDALQKERCRLYAHVLMTHHVHWLVTPARAESVPRLVISLGAVTCNKSTKRTTTRAP